MTYLLVDYSSIMGAYLHLKDDEYAEEVTYKGQTFEIPSVETSLERFQYTVGNLDFETKNFIVVKDPGGPCIPRTQILKDYKKRPRTLPDRFYEVRKELFDAGIAWLKSRGAVIATPKNRAEADDLINELAVRLPDTAIWTRDKDLLACPTDVMYQDKNGLHWNPEKFPVPDEFIHVYRTIVLGDASDNVKSCKGFGPKAWDSMIELFGEDSIKDLNEMLRDRELDLLNEHVEDFKTFQKVIDQAEDLYQSYDVLSFLPVPAHKVRWEGGVIKGKDVLVTAKNYDTVLAQIKKSEFDYVCLDYESDVCDESRAWSKSSGVMVDVMGQEITGMGLRINEDNYYFSVDHADTDNITLSQLEDVLEFLWGKRIYAHNAVFENTLTYNHFEAMLPNVVDTMLMASYVDEGAGLGLKGLSYDRLELEQASFQDTLAGRSGMREVSGEDVLRYGLDDVIATDGIMRLFTVIMLYENTYDVFHKVENDALYFTTMCFINGVDFDEKKYRELKRKNDIGTEESWTKLNDMLLDLDWEGGEFDPVKGMNIGTLNRLHKAAHGTELKGVSSVKMAITMMDDRELAKLAEDKDYEKINDYYRKHWKPAAEFNIRSPKQVSRLLYDVLKLPIRLRNPPTANMKKKGLQGNPRANESAIQNALAYKDTDQAELLTTLLDYKGYLTKESLFLEKYPGFVHWKTGKIHASLRQSATTTRRFSCSRPNMQQLPKFKGKEFRDMLVAKPGYSFVALDFTGQELRLGADDSRDEAFLACYIGDEKKDPHSLTGRTIAEKSGETWDYDSFIFLLNMGSEEVKDYRTIGKKINFTATYGAMAAKIAQTLCITEKEAQVYLDSRAEAFPGLMKRIKEWHRICRRKGYATTMLGARRHLAGHQHYGSKKDFEKQAADRLAYSMRIQGSAAEMTKLVMGRMYRDGIFNDEKAIPFMMIHDELVLQVEDSVIEEQMPKFVDIMCQQYADMIVPMETEPEVGKHLGSLESWAKIQMNKEN